jgi:hypothetical protein
VLSTITTWIGQLGTARRGLDKACMSSNHVLETMSWLSNFPDRRVVPAGTIPEPALYQKMLW